MSDYLIPSPTSWSKADAHAMADDCGDWACEHLPRVGRLDREDLDNSLREKRAFIPQGCDQQGRLQPTIHADAVTEYGMDYEDQTRSATGEVLRVYGLLGAVIAGSLLALHLALTVWPA